MIKRPLCLICICFLAVQAGRVISGQVPSAPQMEPVLRTAAEREESVSVSGFVFQLEQKEKTTEIWLKDAAVNVYGKKIPEEKVVVWLSMWKYGSSAGTADNKDDGDTSRASGEIRLGNQILIRGRAGIFEGIRNPGEFDRQKYYGRKGAAMYVNAKEVEILSDHTDMLQDRLARLRSEWKTLLIRHLGEYYGNTVSAMILGDKSGIDSEMKTLYQKNGIGHLLAISGLHMSFLGMGLYHILRKAGLSFGIAGVTAGSVLILYTVMAGVGVSSLRALIMFLIRIGAEITGRDYDLPTSLSVSAAVLCGICPLYLTDAGFLLSFGAILGLIVLTPVLSGVSRNRVWTALSASLAVNLMLLGPVLYFYYEIPPYSLLLNLLVIPALPVIMGAGIAGSALTLLNDLLGGGVLQIAGLVLRGYDLVCGMTQRLPQSRIVTGRPDGWLLLVYYSVIFLIWMLYLYLSKNRPENHASEAGNQACQRRTDTGHRRKAGMEWMPGLLLIIAGFCMVFLCKSSHSTEGEIQVTMLDVGQGDGIFVRGPHGGTYFIDGGSSDIKSVGAYRIEPFLLSTGTDHLDYVFLSHGDKDHISGIEELLTRQDTGVRICALVLPPPEYHDENLSRIVKLAQETGTRVVVLNAGQRIREKAPAGERNEEKMEIICLAPEGIVADAGDNASSMVLHVRYSAFDMLFTGDLEGAGEETLVRKQILTPCEVLKVAHHGSKYSTAEEFLEAVRPLVGLISAGRENRYGHPHEETLRRLEKSGCRVYTTVQNGAVTIRSDGRSITLDETCGE